MWSADAHGQSAAEGILPILEISTGGQTILDEAKIDVGLTITERSSINAQREISFDGHAGIEIRGRSSSNFAKTGYGLETRDENGENLNVPLLGLPRENDWVLHGPYADKSLIRNALTYEVAQSLGNYAPRTRFVELLIDDEYQGVYLFTEKVKRDKNRVKLQENTPSSLDLSGGYLFQINFDLDHPQAGWKSRISYRPDIQTFSEYSFVYPKAEDISSNQAAYIETWMHDLEELLVSPNFADPSIGYPSKIDIESWIDYILINELSRDVDAYRGSTFLVKKADALGGKLHAGPVWDHNFSYGNSDYCGDQTVEGLAIEFEGVCQWGVAAIIFAKVWEDPTFRKKAAERWFSLRQNKLGPDLFTKLDSLGDLLQEPAKRNFKRWPVLDTYLWPNAYIGKSHQDELQYLGNWITKRLEWLDNHFSQELSIPSFTNSGAQISPNPSSALARPHIRLEHSTIFEFDIDVYHINGSFINSFKATPSERYIPISLKLLPGTYIVTFQIDRNTERDFFKLVVQ